MKVLYLKALRDDLERVLAGEEQADLGETRLPVFLRIADSAFAESNNILELLFWCIEIFLKASKGPALSILL